LADGTLFVCLPGFSVEILCIRHLIEELLEKGFLPLAMAVLVALPVWLRVPGHPALLMGWGEKAGLLPWRSGWQFLGTSLDNLVEFPSIKPNTSALGAIVDLHALSLTHREGDTTDGTWHTGSTAHRGAS
jgi:hypothetical protein